MTKTVTDTIYLYGRPHTSSEDGVYHDISMWKRPKGDGYVLLSEMEVSMEVPEGDLTERFVDSLREVQEANKAECHLKNQNIEEQIQSLRALPAPKPND